MTEFPADLPVELGTEQPVDPVAFRLYLSTGDTVDVVQPDGWGPGHPTWDTLAGFLNVADGWVNLAHVVRVVRQ